jgi:beta-galactosidase
VTLHVTDRLHIPVWGLSVVPTRVASEEAQVEVEVSLRNDRTDEAKVTVEVTIVDPAGGQQTQSLGSAVLRPGSEQVLQASIHILRPQTWSTETPRLYRANTSVKDKGQIVDQMEQTFGLRTIQVSATGGLSVNGQQLLLKGGCMHHDNGLLGAAAFPAAEERRVRLMKASGFNAIRTSHNPPSKAFLDACDRLGVVVVDEFVDMWERPKRPNDYSKHFADRWESDLTAFVRRDRNHPSVVIWSIGNEINERAAPTGLSIAANLVAAVRKLDTTRPVTNAICDFWDNPGAKWEVQTPAAFALLDVGGYNYQVGHYASDHAAFPNRVMMGTESFPKAALENWRAVESLPYVIGDFVWTGMDYLGESGVGHFEYFQRDEKERFSMPWPWWVSWCGDIDITGNKKPQSLYRDVVWDRSRLEILVHAPQPAGAREAVHYWGWPDEEPHWTWTGHQGVPLRVNVYTKAERVRLELNGAIVGESAARGGEGITATFEVPYAPGTLKAIALTGGREIGSQTLRTVGLPSAVQLSPETGRFTADRDSLLFVPIEIVDAGGQVVPTAVSRLNLLVDGAGELLAFGNASPWISGSFRDAVTEAFRGRALAVIRSTGKPGPVKIMVSSAGIRAGVIEVQASP